MIGTLSKFIWVFIFILGDVQSLNKCPTDNSIETLLPHEKCNSFYQCVAGELVTHRCAANLQFNIDTKLCDWPDRVVCGDRSDNESEDLTDDQPENHTINDDPSLAPIICAAEGSNGVLVAHEYCNKFYKCAWGLPVALQCQLNLQYNPSKEQCDWPENVDCGNRLTSDDEGDGSISDDGDHPSDDGGNNDSPNGGHENPSEAPAICAAEGSEGVLVAHEYCNMFYKCSRGLPVALKCQLYLRYNPSKEQCDWPENVDCANRLISNDEDNNDISDDGDNPSNDSGNNNSNNGGHDNPSEAPAICAADGSEGVLVAHEYCNMFYKCSGGLPVALKCQLNLHYNPSKEQCDWPENVDCANRLISNDEDNSDIGDDSDHPSNDGGNNDSSNGGHENPSEAPAICAADGSEGVLVAHEYCNMFYKCSGGLPVALTCQLNLQYNPSKEQCDWPENVDCANRLISNDEDNNDISDDGDNPSNNSGNNNSNNGGHDNPSEAPAICAAEGSEGVLVAHEYCNMFYKCSRGLPVALKCQLNLYYNPSKEQCDWPENVDCANRLISNDEDNNDINDDGDNPSNDSGNNDSNDGEHDNVNEAPAICATAGSDGTLIAHEYCDKFYLCAHGLPVTFQCQSNLRYNPRNEQCDWPENVDCTGRK